MYHHQRLCSVTALHTTDPTMLHRSVTIGTSKPSKPTPFSQLPAITTVAEERSKRRKKSHISTIVANAIRAKILHLEERHAVQQQIDMLRLPGSQAPIR